MVNNSNFPDDIKNRTETNPNPVYTEIQSDGKIYIHCTCLCKQKYVKSISFQQLLETFIVFPDTTLEVTCNQCNRYSIFILLKDIIEPYQTPLINVYINQTRLRIKNGDTMVNELITLLQQNRTTILGI